MATKKEINETKEEIKEVKKTEETIERKPRTRTRRKAETLKKIDKDAQILLMNNVSKTELFYKCELTRTSFTMKGYGDTVWVSYEVLKAMKNTAPSMLEKYWVIPIAVDSDDVTIEDVFKNLNISKLYDEDMLYEDNVDYIINDTKFRSFKMILEEVRDGYFETIVERALKLAQQGEFNDFQKMDYIEKLVGQEDLFKNALRNKE